MKRTEGYLKGLHDLVALLGREVGPENVGLTPETKLGDDKLTVLGTDFNFRCNVRRDSWSGSPLGAYSFTVCLPDYSSLTLPPKKDGTYSVEKLLERILKVARERKEAADCGKNILRVLDEILQIAKGEVFDRGPGSYANFKGNGVDVKVAGSNVGVVTVLCPDGEKAKEIVSLLVEHGYLDKAQSIAGGEK